MARDHSTKALAWAQEAEHYMLVGGDLVPAAGGRTYDATDPSTEAVLGRFPDADAPDIESAIAAAEDARKGWASQPIQERATIVRQMADVVDANLDEIAALDSLDTGVSYEVMRKDVATGVRRMRMFADWALLLTGDTIPSTPTHLTYTERIPFGIVARIVAYNHPAMFGLSKIAAPLIAGNPVVLKPSQDTPLSMSRLAELWVSTVPPGVLSIITAATVAAGEQLVRDARVRRVAFTGSPATGRSIQRTAAEAAVKSVSLELGGKNAMVVLPDADLDSVVAGAIRGMNMSFAGQSCGSTSRVLLPIQHVDEVVGQLEERFKNLRVGGPFENDVQVSPLITSAHHDRVSRHVHQAEAGTGQLVTGGARPEQHVVGHFFAPTIIVENDARSSLATEEIFGPVLTVIPTEDTSQAIKIANSTPYGLTGSVYGSDIGQALSTAGQLETGYVWVNDTATHFAGLPFGGVKDSGVGREESFDELLDYTQLRSTSVRLG